jgi:SAM-dependent methyltransferase
MRMASLAETGLGVFREEVRSLFEPFVSRTVPADNGEWQAEMSERKKKIMRKFLKRLLLGWRTENQRHEEAIVKEYSDVWERTDFASYNLVKDPPRYSPWEWDGERMFASTIGATRFRQLLLARVIERLKPRTVLEVGCGNGINLILLSCRFPGVAFTGIELTAAGNRAAVEFQRTPELPLPMREFAPLPLTDTTAFRRISFLQGSAAHLPFDDGAFDLVLTVLALEQMERVRNRALAEIVRVSGGHTLMMEPLRDVNSALWPRLNVLRRNYFQARIDDLIPFGLKPIMATSDFPQETFLRACAVLAEKII